MTTQNLQPQPLHHHLPKDFARPQSLDDALVGAAASVSQYQAWLQTIPENALHFPVAPGKWSVAETPTT